MKTYSGKRYRNKPHSLKIVDSVLVKQKMTDKTQPMFDPTPYTVTTIKGNMITAQREGKEITRNVSFFKVWKATKQ